MPTQIVIDITDPVNLDAWGLHPAPSGLWSAGSWAQGTVCAYNNVVWLAIRQTSGVPGVSADWVVLLAVSGLALDGNGFLPMANLPITKGQAIRALKANGGTLGGAAYPGALNWWKIVENALATDESDANNVYLEDAFWPIGGGAWAFVQTSLADGLGSFTQMATLQAYAITNR